MINKIRRKEDGWSSLKNFFAALNIELATSFLLKLRFPVPMAGKEMDVYWFESACLKQLMTNFSNFCGKKKNFNSNLPINNKAIVILDKINTF